MKGIESDIVPRLQLRQTAIVRRNIAPRLVSPGNVMLLDDEPHNGFQNYETWCVHWWLKNDLEVFRRCQELVADTNDIISEASSLIDGIGDATRAARELLADLLSELVDEFNPVANQTTLFSDLMGTALSEVDWEGIADRFLSQTYQSR